jgi:hypothetical protein
VVDYININGQLALKAVVAKDDDRRNFMIRHLEDQGSFLLAYYRCFKAKWTAGIL